jgi:carboxypeptidase Q
MKFFAIILLFCIGISHSVKAQENDDRKSVEMIFEEALSDSTAYESLRYLSKEIGGRLPNSPEAREAVHFTAGLLKSAGADTVFFQKMMVKNWVRGEETATVTSRIHGTRKLIISDLGMAVPTGPEGIQAKVIEVDGIEQLEMMGEEAIRGRIVFFNRPMDPTLKSTFTAYGKAASQRVQGPSSAAKYGAVGAVIRSLTLATDKHPHTGVTRYEEGVQKIPAVCICTAHADLLSEWLRSDPDLELFCKTTSRLLPDVESYNVIGEIRGTEYPDEYLIIGGHLDAWDTSEGAHDDGVGCIQSIEVLRIFTKLGIRPKHSIRAVMFMDEEVSGTGSVTYANHVRDSGEKHLAAIECDRGGTSPVGFYIDAPGEIIDRIARWKPLFLPYGIHLFTRGGSGADVGRLKEFNTVLIGYLPETNRYFDFHHSPNDTFEKVNKREMQMGSAANAALIYLIDKYGLE